MLLCCLHFLEIKFSSFSLNAKSQETPEVTFSILKNQELTSGTGYPPIQFFSHKEITSEQKQIWIARSVGAFEAFDLEQNSLIDKVVFPFTEDRKIVNLFSHGNEVVALNDQGEVAFWNEESQSATVKELKEFIPVTSAKRGNLLALGGRGLKNNFQLWDLDALEAKFVAKQTQNVRLNMPYPVDVRGIAFTQKDSSEVVVTCNADGQLWLYDTRVKRTPILEKQVQPKRTSLVSVHATDKDDCVIYTTADGIVEYYDLRKGRSCGRFGPHEGAVTDLHITTGTEKGHGKLLITACKDRFLRIFDFSSRALLSKIYLKHVPNAFAVIDQSWFQVLDKEYEDSEDEEFWEDMNEVTDTKKRKLE